MFQSTPDLVNRENFRSMYLHLPGNQFQSTPDLVNRENPLCLTACQYVTCFNPLPI